MCWHKWAKWSEPQEVSGYWGGTGEWNQQTVIRFKQTRECEKCGAAQSRYIDE